jgi:hypothetical protein
MPVSGRRTNADTNPAVLNPAPLNSDAIVVAGWSVKPRLSRTLCSNGRCPVNRDACDGNVWGAWA